MRIARSFPIVLAVLSVACRSSTGMARVLPVMPRAVRSQEAIKAATDAHRTEFDYLLGDWEFTGANTYGAFRGRWSAVRVPDTDQILDEFRIVGDSGQTVYVVTTWRAYNAVTGRWELVSVEAGGTGLANIGTAHRADSEMRVSRHSGTDRAHTSRIRYYDIHPDHFSWTADRSVANGKTWIPNFQPIEARRVGPPRTIPTLTPASIDPAQRRD